MPEAPQNPYESPRADLDAGGDPRLGGPSPDERASFRLGLWALLLNVLCGCFPVAIVLGILAVTRHNKAKLATAAEPGRYAVPASTGMVLGIIGMVWSVFALVYVGIIAAIAIPALLSQRSRARDKVAIERMVSHTVDLVGEYDRLSAQHTPPEQISGALETYLRAHAGLDRNPWGPAIPACDFHVHVVSGLDRDAMDATASDAATDLGETVFVLELPVGQQPGYLVGAVKTQFEIRGSHVRTKVVELD